MKITGVLNRIGKVVIYSDYDEIGFNDMSKYTIEQEIRNNKLLYDECIPVKKEGKYGLFDLEGNELLPVSYDDLGYIKTSKDKNGETSTLIIPTYVGIKGIVVKYDQSYGIYDVNKKEIIIPCVCTRIYSVNKLGKTTYYVEYNGEQIELSSYLEQNNLKSVTEDEKNIEEDTDSNETENKELDSNSTSENNDIENVE